MEGGEFLVTRGGEDGELVEGGGDGGCVGIIGDGRRGVAIENESERPSIGIAHHPLNLLLFPGARVRGVQIQQLHGRDEVGGGGVDLLHFIAHHTQRVHLLHLGCEGTVRVLHLVEC